MTALQLGWSLRRSIPAVLLVVVLSAPSMTSAGPDALAAPLPKSPSVYALLYVAKMPGVADLEDYRRRQAALFKRETGARLALSDPKVAELKVLKGQERPVDWLAERLQTEFLGDTGVFKLTVAGVPPEDQALVLNAIVKAYDREYEQPLPTMWAHTLETYKKSLASCKVSLQRSEAMLGKEELDRLPPQIDRGEYVKAIKMEIEDRKAALKKAEEGVEHSEKMLKALPLVRVIEWAEAPPSK